MSVRESFVRQFGEEDAVSIEKAAREHKNGVHDKTGTDPFKWAILICIGYQCFEYESYRKHHGIKASFLDIKRWCIEEADLGSHDGDCDYISLMTGAYNDFVTPRLETPDAKG